jgi:restriction system protein
MTPTKSYYRIMAGKGCIYAAQCFEQGFIGVDWAVSSNLSDLISDSAEAFNDGYLSFYYRANPDSNKIAAGLARSATFNIWKRI